MSRELSTKKDIIKSVAIKSEFSEEQLEEYYKFFMERMERLMNDPQTISIRISKYMGDIYLKLKYAKRRYIQRVERGFPIPEDVRIGYEKMGMYIDKIKERKAFTYFKRNYLHSKFMSGGLTPKELEEKQNKVYERRRQNKTDS